MPNIDLMISDDYASVENDHHRFYYGYEAMTSAGEWCFVVRQKRTLFECCRLTKSELEAAVPRIKGDEPHAYLLVGAMLYFSEMAP